MAQLGMTIDPSFTHRVVEILNEKLWEGDIDGIDKFMDNCFGITDRKLNADILAGKYVMIFNEDGSGDIKPHEEVTPDEIEAMNHLPKLMTINDIHDIIHLRINGGCGLLERQKYVILNFRDVLDYHHAYAIDFDSSVLRSDVINLLDENADNMIISTSLTTKEIIGIYNAVKQHKTSNNVLESIKNSNDHAARLIYIIDQTDELFHIQANIVKSIDYIKEFIFEDVYNIDKYKENGMKATPDEQMENLGRYFWMPVFFSRCNEINEYYQYIITDPDHQELISKMALSNESIAHAAVHSRMDSDQDTRRMKRYNTGDPLLDSYIESVNAKHPTSPAKPDGGRWDAGWISPEGAFWADKGTKANFIHLNLAEAIQKYYADSFDWMAKAENIDHELEKHGWLKFHGKEVSFTGYSSWNSGKQQRITSRQIDKLHDYAKHMGFTSLTASFTNKRIDVNEMFEYSPEEWQAIFEF